MGSMTTLVRCILLRLMVQAVSVQHRDVPRVGQENLERVSKGENPSITQVSRIEHTARSDRIGQEMDSVNDSDVQLAEAAPMEANVVDFPEGWLNASSKDEANAAPDVNATLDGNSDVDATLKSKMETDVSEEDRKEGTALDAWAPVIKDDHLRHKIWSRQTDIDDKRGDGALWMDAFLFPDPVVDRVDKSVQEAAKEGCMEHQHLVIIGVHQDWTVWPQSNRNSTTQCVFHTSKDWGPFKSDARMHPDEGCPTKDPTRQPTDGLLVCEVPPLVREAVRNVADSADITVELVSEGEGMVNPPTMRVGSLLSHTLRSALIQHKYSIDDMMPTSKYKLVVASMIKNIDSGIRNWMAWHISKGVEHFFLYDNNGDATDKTYTADYEEAGYVTRLAWPYCCSGPDNNQGQRGALNHALYKFGQVAEWLVFLDVDEYIVTYRKNILDVLDGMTNRHGPAVSMESVIMGPCEDRTLWEDQSLLNFGSVPVSSKCRPQASNRMYPGKMFVNTKDAYRQGMVEISPHPNALSGQIQSVSHAMTIAHFRKDFTTTGHHFQLTDDQEFADHFQADFEQFCDLGQSNRCDVAASPSAA